MGFIMIDERSQEIQIQIEHIRKLNIVGNLQEMRIQVDLLLENARLLHSSEGIAAALLFDSFLSNYSGEVDEGIEKLGHVVTLSNEKELHDYSMRAYNSLANNYSKKGDYYSSLSYYLKAYHIAQAHPEYQYDYVVLNNIGNLFEWLDEYETAASYLEQSYEKYMEMEIDDQPFLLNLVINLVDVYSYLEDFEKAEKWANSYSMDSDEDAEVVTGSLSLMNRAVHSYRQKDFNEAAGLMESFLAYSAKTSDYIYIFRCLIHLLWIALDMENPQVIEKLIERMDILQNQTVLDSFEYRYAELKLEYYRRYLCDAQTTGDIYTETYFKESKKTIAQLKHTYVQSLVVQLELEKTRQDALRANEANEILQRNMQKDVFTNLYNKVGSEQIIRNQIGQRAPDCMQLLVILDVDHFKNINDIYGHYYGDVVIRKTADILECIDLPDKIVGRFGGDEYVIFVNGITDAETVEPVLRKLLALAHEIQLPDNRIRRTTFSIGACLIAAPISYEQAFAEADALLYQAKEQGRNRAILACAQQENLVVLGNSDGAT